jgi:hypothetical protein
MSRILRVRRVAARCVGGTSRLLKHRTAPLLWSVALVLLLIAYVRWLAPSLSPYAGGSDASGYLWSARLFSRGTL